MERLNQRRVQLEQALASLERVLVIFKELGQGRGCCAHAVDREEEYRIHRDSVIQRFEYCIDLLWKYLKLYLAQKDVVLDINVAGEAVRQACVAKIVTESEAEQLLAMIKSRNMTSHIYIEAIAQQLVVDVARYYQVMLTITKRLVL